MSSGSVADDLIRQASAESEPAVRSRLLVRAAELLLTKDPARARAAAEEALTTARRNSGEPVVVDALVVAAEAGMEVGDFAAARRYCTEGRDAAVQVRRTQAECRFARIHGRVELLTGGLSAARTLLERSLVLARELADVPLQAAILEDYGRVLQEMGDTEQALAAFRQAMALGAADGEGDQAGESLLNISRVHDDSGDWEKALEYAFRSLVTREREFDRAGMAGCLAHIGEIHLRHGVFDKAISALTRAEECAVQARSLRSALVAVGLQGEAYLMTGDLLRARDCLDRSVREAERLGLRPELATGLCRQAELLLALDEVETARARAERARELVREMGGLRGVAGVERVLGRIHARAGESEKAEACFVAARAGLPRTAHSFELARVQRDCGYFRVETGQRESGIEQLQAAARLFRHLEAVGEAEAIERYLLRFEVGPDHLLRALRALSALCSQPLPADEILPRSLRLVRDAVGCDRAGLLFADGHEFPAGTFRPDAVLRRVRESGEIVELPDEVWLPLRFSGREVGVLGLLGCREPERRPDRSFLQTVANLLSVAVGRSLERNRSVAPDIAATPVRPGTARPIVGRSAVMRGVFDQVERVAPTRASVLVRGETGTGKELVARLVHERSPRAAKPFVAVNCAAIPDELLESEIFGIETGVATGVTARAGRLEVADGGTLFLDEIGDMSVRLQVKLLRVMHDRSYEPVGSRRTRQADIRILAATHQDLEQLMRANRFREDLYYRLNVMTIVLPPLRDRREDIPLLVAHFIEKQNRIHGRRVRCLSREAEEALLCFRWPGNVRELENLIESCVILTEGDVIKLSDLPSGFQSLVTPAAQEVPEPGPGIATLDDLRDRSRRLQTQTADEVERMMLVKALDDNHGRANRAAAHLGISRAHFYRLLAKHGIARPKKPNGEAMKK